MFSSADEVLSYIRNEGVRFVDCRFVDLFTSTGVVYGVCVIYDRFVS
ncbi:hypothetical protein Acsp03_09020 [Actinomadura sp. NBRC 104412]|nr:hypothetical protein Acsp03_09020 [Actinomadura sp. NBRC 104412]